MLRADQRERYARHLSLTEVGADGQRRLLAGRVRVVGVGPAAEEAAIYLTAAGVGSLALDTALRARLVPRLAALNGDTTVLDAAATAPNLLTREHLAAPGDPDARSAGALAALTALTALAKGEAPLTWQIDATPAEDPAGGTR